MLGKSTSNMSLEELQKAVMGGNPAIEPYQALAAIEKMVKAEKAKTAQMAQQPRPQGIVAQQKLAEAAALRNPYMASGLGAAPVAPPVTAPMGEQAPVGMAGGGMVAFAKGGITPYESDFEALSDEDRIAALQKYKTALGANNAEMLAPLEAQQAKYAQEAEKTKKGGLGDALIAAGLGTLAGKSQHAMQNIGEGGLKGLASYQESQKAAQMAQDKMLQSQADMAKSRIALEKGDETTAAALQNQARQEAQAAGQFKLQGQYYAGSNAAQMVAAQNRGLAGGLGDSKQRLASLKLLQADLQGRLDTKKHPDLMMAKNATQKAELQAQLEAINAEIASIAKVGTMAANTPGAGAAGGQNVYNFNDITKPQ
jgi:hypothetical protein